MRQFPWSVAWLVLFLGAGTPVHAEESARAIIKRALKACGVTATDQPLALCCKYCIRDPDGDSLEKQFVETLGDSAGLSSRVKFIDAGEKKPYGGVVTHAGKSWVNIDGKVEDLEGESLTWWLEMQHAMRVVWLLPLLQDKKFTLSCLGESTFQKRTLLGVKVVYPGRKDVLLYFDKATGLLARSEFTWRGNSHLTQVFRDCRVVDWGAAEVKVLRKARVATDGPALLTFLRGQMPNRQREAKVSELIRQLGHRSFRARRDASQALLAMGQPAVRRLGQATRHPDLEVAQRAAELIRRLGGDQGVHLRRAAIHLLAQRKPAGAAEVLLNYLPHARSAAEAREVQGALAAVAFRDGKAEPCLLQALKGPEAARRHAAAALGRDGGAFARLPGRRLYLGGLKIAHRIVFLAGKDNKLFEMEMIDLQIFNRHDDQLFARP